MPVLLASQKLEVSEDIVENRLLCNYDFKEVICN